MINEKAVYTANFIWSVYLLIMVDTLLLRLSLHFTQLHFTALHLSTLRFLSFKLHPTTLHYPLIWLNSIKFPTASFHCTFRWFSPHFYSFHFIPFIIAFLNLFLKNLGLDGKVPNASAGSWFQFLMILFTKEYFPISVLCFLSLIFLTWSTLLKYGCLCTQPRNITYMNV